MTGGQEQLEEVLQTHFTFRGWMALNLCCICLCISLLFANAPLLQLSLFGLLLLLLSHILCHLNLQNIQCRHMFPTTVYCDEPCYVELTLENWKTDFCARQVMVIDRIATVQKEVPILFRHISPAESIDAMLDVQFPHRGIFKDTEFHISSDFPLGFSVSEKRDKRTGRIVVCPRPKMPRDIQQLLDASVGYGGSCDSASDGLNGEFRSVREYRLGDHPRRISWPISAHMQKLIVREWEQPHPLEVSIIFHSFQPAGVFISHKSFETSLRLMSGFLDYFTGHQLPFEFMASFTDWEKISVPVTATAFLDFQFLLAGATLKRTHDFAEISQIIQSESRASVLQIVASNTPKRFWEHLVPVTPGALVCVDNEQASQLLTQGRLRS